MRLGRYLQIDIYDIYVLHSIARADSREGERSRERKKMKKEREREGKEASSVYRERKVENDR